MFRAVLAKEIRNHLLSFRFMAVFVMLMVVIPVTVLILSTDTIRKQEEYSRRQAEIQAYLGQYAHFNRLFAVISPSQPPIAMLALARGLADDANINAFNNDPLPVMFPLIDLVFVVTILLSLAALVFSYDAVSGEREDGTLKLALANGVPRSTVLAGKFAGGAIVLFVPFLIALSLGLIYVLLHPRIGWSAVDGGALGLLLAGSAVYTMVFYGLGFLISARHASSASSIMTSLVVWVVLVLVVPNLSPYLAELANPAPSRIRIGREVARMTDVERDELGRKLSAERRGAVIRDHPVLADVERMSESDIKATIARDPEFARAYALFRSASEAAWKEANVIQGQKAQVLREELSRKEEAQTRLALNLSLASPLAGFTYLATDLTSTGMLNQRHFAGLVRAWTRNYGEYMQKKMAEMRQADPTVDLWNTAVDVSDMPRFVYKEAPLADRLRAALVPFLILSGMALAFIALAYVSFIRYDVR
jgi:ABC-type transport system involved in multi-copper enzyme maturation permease subunit